MLEKPNFSTEPGLLPHLHVNAYARRTQVTKLSDAGSRGTAGAFAHLLERYGQLEDWINQQIRKRRVVLKQHSAGDGSVAKFPSGRGRSLVLNFST